MTWDRIEMFSAFPRVIDDIIETGRWLDCRGWVPATGGNFSYRIDDAQILMTVSGRHKGELVPDDIMRVDYMGQSLDGKKPSAETLLHTGLYKIHPNINAILHIHPRSCVVYSMQHDADHVVLSGYELLKAFPNVGTHEAHVSIPIFDNTQDMMALQIKIDAWYKKHPGTIPVYLVRGHGLTVGAKDIKTARYMAEATEELFAYECTLGGNKT